MKINLPVSGIAALIRLLYSFTLILSFSSCSTLSSPSFFKRGEDKKEISSDATSSLASEKKNDLHEMRKWYLTAKLVQPLGNALGEDLLNYRKIQRSSPLIVKDILVQANSQGGIQAFRIGSSGLSKLWYLPIVNGVEASLAHINDRIFFGASDGNFYSVNLLTGEVLWKFPVKSEVLAQPIIDEEGRLFFLAGNNVLYSLDAADGRQLWVYSRQDTANMTVRGGSRPAVKDGILYVGFSDGSLVALAAKSGAAQWEIQLNKNKKFRDLDAAPIIDGERLYLSSYDDKLYCISRKNGEVLWKSESGGFETPTLDGDRIYLPGSGGDVSAIDKNSGKLLWKYSGLEGVSTQVRPLTKNLIVLGDSLGKLLILNKRDGKLAHSFEPGRGVFASPEIDYNHNMIYFISNEANLYGLEFKPENPKWIPYLQ